MTIIVRNDRIFVRNYNKFQSVPYERQHYALLFKGDDVNKSKSAYYTDMNDVRKYASSYNMKPMMISLFQQMKKFLQKQDQKYIIGAY